jgi:nucleotide-binding universal stress UspA family protein
MLSLLQLHRDTPPVTAPGRPYSRIVVAVESSEASARAVSLAISLARGDARVELIFAHVIDAPLLRSLADPVGDDYERSVNVARTEALGLLDRCMDAAAKSQVFARSCLRYGTPAIEVARLARGFSADLVAVGNRHRDRVHRFLNGSIHDDIVRASGVPVLVAAANESGPADFRNGCVLAEPADGSESSAVLRVASAIASAYRAKLVSLPATKSAQARTKTVSMAFRDLHPALFVIGATSQHHWRDRFFPNFVERTLQTVTIPILIVRA